MYTVEELSKALIRKNEIAAEYERMFGAEIRDIAAVEEAAKKRARAYVCRGSYVSGYPHNSHRIADIVLGVDTVTVYLEDYCGEGHYEPGKVFKFPTQWLTLTAYKFQDALQVEVDATKERKRLKAEKAALEYAERLRIAKEQDEADALVEERELYAKLKAKYEVQV